MFLSYAVRVGGLLLNITGGDELATMPKDKPTPGPMRTQPIERAWAMSTPALPKMPAVGGVSTPKPKQKPTRAEAVRVAKAKITRRKSLRKQREALRG
jgi:hypothetical protein